MEARMPYHQKRLSRISVSSKCDRRFITNQQTNQPPKHRASVMLCDRANAPTIHPLLPKLLSTDRK